MGAMFVLKVVPSLNVKAIWLTLPSRETSIRSNCIALWMGASCKNPAYRMARSTSTKSTTPSSPSNAWTSANWSQ